MMKHVCNPEGWRDFSASSASCSYAIFPIWPSSHAFI
jgi:hypothetical protein